MQRCSVAWCYSTCLHGLQVRITSSARMSCRCLSNALACLGNTRASLHDVAAKPSFISMTHSLWRAMGHVSAPEPTSEVGAVRSRRMRISAGPLLSGEAGFDVERRMTVSDPSWMVKGGLEPLGTWQRRSPPRRRGGVLSLRHVAASEPSLSREAGSDAAVARGSVWTHILPFVFT
jgi:hypothetical protein